MRTLAAACLLLVSLCPAFAQRAAHSGKPGVFDYYVLSLSWSPEFCAGPGGASSRDQCGGERRYGFVVHGLWPQYEKGWPEDCDIARRVDSSLVRTMLPLMPSPKLIQHEWDKHGTCSGLPQKEYFDRIGQAFEAVRIPDDFKQPLAHVEVRPADFRKKFLAANPGLRPGALHIRCSGRYLSEVQLCLTRDMKWRTCGSDVRDRCSAPTMILRPVR